MSTAALLNEKEVSLRFASPWDLETYKTFLLAKRLPEARYDFDRESDSYTVSAPSRFAPLVGLDAPCPAGRRDPLAEFLFPVQRWIVERALQARRFAIWADCGFGKTPMGLEWARQVALETGGRIAILVPAQLIEQWSDEMMKFYPNVIRPLIAQSRDHFIKWCQDADAHLCLASHHLFVDGPIDELRHCTGIVLDESSILKGGGGVIKWNLIKSCRGIEYKLSLTATPAPNDTMEYASQASWLEKLRNEGEILWTYFQRDSASQEWKIRPHARKAFYRFMSAWSIYIRKGSAYGFEDTFDVPEPELVEHKLDMTEEQAAEYRRWVYAEQGQLLAEDRLDMVARTKLSQIAKGFIYWTEDNIDCTRRLPSLKPPLVAELATGYVSENRQLLIWTVFDEESDILAELLKPLGERVDMLHGRDGPAVRSRILERFRKGEVRCLISKARLLGYGMNFQFCTRMIFSGFDDSFEKFYQAVRRAHRYGATERLRVDVPFIPELESHMWNNLLRKRRQWETDIEQMERNYVEAMRA